jgi:Flp pilus assembly protein TadG
MNRFRRQEDGAVAVIAALCMVALVGFVALAMDVGVLFVKQTQLQKAADAAALAGAAGINLKSFTAGSCPSIGSGASASSAQQYLSANDGDAVMVCNQGIIVSNGACAANGCDAWRVSASQTVAFSFAPVMGINQATISATATAIASPISAAQNPLYYALWAGNPATWPDDSFFPTTPSPQDYYCADSTSSTWPGTPHCDGNGGLAPGSFGPSSTGGYVINDNNYQSKVIYGDPNKCWDPASGPNKKGDPECNPNYPASFTSNGFKGFFGPKSAGDFMSGIFQVGSQVQVFQGGIQNQDLCPSFANVPMVAPLIGKVTFDSGSQKYFFTIAAFRVVTTNCAKTTGQTIVVNVAIDQRITQGVPGGKDVNSPIVVELWQ